MAAATATATATTELSGAGRPLPPLPADGPRLRIPTLRDIYQARKVVNRYLKPTPLLTSPALSERLGCELFLKCENLQPTGAFKVRGGLNLMSQLSAEEKANGVVTASTGNHGQSIAFAAREFGVRAIVYMPEQANPLKVAAMRRLGAEVLFHGPDFDTCRVEAEAHAARAGMYYVHAANEARLIAGVATYSLEIMEEVPDLDVLIVPVGGGSGLCGACLAGKGINPNLTVIGVQSSHAPVVHDSWRRRELLEYDRAPTFAEGMATRVAFELPAHILWDRVDDIRLVTDADLRRAILTLLETTRMLAEGAGAAAVAAAYQMSGDLAGKKVATVLSGGNLTLDGLRQAMDEETPW
jgi:threonine dehydratase